MDPEFLRFLVIVAGAMVGGLILTTAATWVHREYHKRHAEGRAPRWLYYLEYTRSLLGHDVVYGLPEPPKPNAK